MLGNVPVATRAKENFSDFGEHIITLNNHTPTVRKTFHQHLIFVTTKHNFPPIDINKTHNIAVMGSMLYDTVSVKG